MTVQEIYGLIKTNQVHRFYNDGAWKQLAATIRKEQHNECQRCKANGKYHYAVLVHHVNHLREHPELAYSKTYIDSNGQEQRNLILLCSQCHEAVHANDRHKPREIGFENEERW